VKYGENIIICAQTAAVVLAVANVDVYAETKTGEINLEIAYFSLGWVEVDENVVVIPHYRSQDSGSFDIYYRNGGILPFAPVQDEIRRVNALGIPVSGINTLSFRPFRRGERILPTQPVPVIDVKSDWNKCAPQS